MSELVTIFDRMVGRHLEIHPVVLLLVAAAVSAVAYWMLRQRPLKEAQQELADVSRFKEEQVIRTFLAKLKRQLPLMFLVLAGLFALLLVLDYFLSQGGQS